MAEHNYLEADSDLNWLCFLANYEMQPLFSDNLFAIWLTEDNSSTSLLGLSSDLVVKTAHIGGSEIFSEDTTVLSAFPSDPPIGERAVQYSSFADENCQNAEESAQRTSIALSKKGNERAFESGISGNDNNHSPLNKRKTLQKAVYTEAAKGKRPKVADKVRDVEVSKDRAQQSNNDNCAEKTEKENSVKAFPAPLEKPRCILVKARRGEATDRHSLAERVRRKKISERMKSLQYLVPGCSKITGKALKLQKVIDYIQSLHRQVEFLSMKTATVDSRFNFINHHICAKGITTCCHTNAGYFAELASSRCLQYETMEQSNVCFPMLFRPENSPPGV